MAYTGAIDGLKTLEVSPDGNGTIVPKTRMQDAMAVQNWSRRIIDNDEKRSWKRSRVNGLVDGNPPYKTSDLKKAGRADACSVNWGTARSYLESAGGAFYDLFSESPGYITVYTAYGTPEQRVDWSNIIAAEADRILKKSPIWDYEMSLSIDNLILHGCGPMIFEDAFRVLPKAFLCGDLKVPEFTKSEPSYWEAALVQATYFPPELFAFIENRKVAESVGWNVEFSRQVIANAMGLRNQAGHMYEWEFYQQELKNNSLSYFDEPKVCRVCHVFWKEFDSSITHAIVERDTSSGLKTEFLYHNIGRYRNWQQVIHPMYFDHGNGGYHHSVTGLGVKMFAAMEYENRLICNLCDKAFAPKVLFKPTTSDARQKFELFTYGDFGVLPRGLDAMQNPVAGLMDDGLRLHDMLGNLVSSNLSSYRQQVPAQRAGNPPTKFQKQLEASLQSALSKTQFNRFYEQLDTLYTEIYRRLSNINSTDPLAQEFQKRCEKEGVPKEAIGRIEKIQATRVVGQGSSFMRKSAIDSLFMVAPSLPEEGRDNLISDKIAAEAGQEAVRRYYPKAAQKMPSDQQAEATQWVAAMKIGVPPIITSSQNATTYAATFLAAATTAVQSLQQGGDPADVLKFLMVAGPAIAAHLKRIEQDPMRQQVYEKMQEQWQQLAQMTDRLKAVVQKNQQAMKKQKERTGQVLSDQQLKMLKTTSDIKLKETKTRAQMQQSAQKHGQKLQQGAQEMVLKDASTASEIHRNRLKSLNE
jgi:hypothetical protein